ncbi:hypothetical protein ACVKU6_000876 [Stenotrophomonas sp. PvP086]
MNPSMGARWRHPWRQRSCLPTPTRPARASLRRTARALGFQVEGGVRSVLLRKTDLTPEVTWLLSFALLSSIRGGRAREVSVAGRVGCAGARAAWGRGMPRAGWAGCPTPVLPCAQDSAHVQAATELTETYLQRPLRNPSSRPKRRKSAALSDHPEGLRRWLDNQIPPKQKRPSTGPGRSCNSGQAGIRTPASPRRPVRWPSGDHPPCGGPAGQPGPGQPVQRRAAPGR